MKKQIKLYSQYGKYIQAKEFLNIKENLEIELLYNFESGVEVYYIANNGTSTKKGLVQNNKFEIPTSFLKVGSLSIKIEVVSGEEVKHTFTCENLLIKENDNKIYTIPEVDTLKQEIAKYTEVVNKLNEKCDILTKLVGGLYETDIKVGIE